MILPLNCNTLNLTISYQLRKMASYEKDRFSTKAKVVDTIAVH